MTHKIILFFLFLLFTLNSLAQETITISGTVSDAASGEGIGFVNIGIEGTSTGTASNEAGEFELKIPPLYQRDRLYFSAIGYENLIIGLADFLKDDKHNLVLQPLTYGIDDIEVSAESKVLYRIVHETANNIPASFVSQAYAYTALYSNEIFVQNNATKRRDALVELSDQTAYRDRKNAYQSINYKIVNVSRNFEISDLLDGTTLVDELLSFDIARCQYNVLDTSRLSAFDLQLVETMPASDDTIYIIGYQLSEPELTLSGNWQTSTYSGRLHISKSKKVLLKHELRFSSRRQSIHGRAVASENPFNIYETENHAVVTYRMTPQGLIPDNFSLSRNYYNEEKQKCRTNSTLKLLGVDFHEPEMIDGRQYFENLLPDPDFWVVLKEKYPAE